MKSAVAKVTQRIAERSAPLRTEYLQRLARLRDRPRGSERLGCANVAHAFAALPAKDKFKIVREHGPNLSIVTAHNDMLSAHQPYETYPSVLHDEARRCGATAQVAGGVSAMCDGVTQASTSTARKNLSGASGKVPAAIHVSPEALAGGAPGKVRDGDPIRLDVVAGTLEVRLLEAEWRARECATPDAAHADVNGHGLGRELFAGMRRNVKGAEEGAITWM